MIGAMSDSDTVRVLRQFAVACCRSVWPLLASPRCRDADAVAEAFADGRAGRRELTEARDAYRDAASPTGYTPDGVGEVVREGDRDAAFGAASQAAELAVLRGAGARRLADIPLKELARRGAEQR